MSELAYGAATMVYIAIGVYLLSRYGETHDVEDEDGCTMVFAVLAWPVVLAGILGERHKEKQR